MTARNSADLASQTNPCIADTGSRDNRDTRQAARIVSRDGCIDPSARRADAGPIAFTLMPRRPTDNTPVHGFAAVAATGARILILGSMPGRASLAANEYYAHPRNQFWPIVGSLFGFDPRLAYADRLQALQTAGVALWDVLASCVRPTSMDADIDTDSLVVNDFAGLFREHAGIAQVFFNGATAAEFYRRHALPKVSSHRLSYHRLPSTSPAHAGMGLQEKLAAWQTVARALAGRRIDDAGFRIWKDDRQ